MSLAAPAAVSQLVFAHVTLRLRGPALTVIPGHASDKVVQESHGYPSPSWVRRMRFNNRRSHDGRFGGRWFGSRSCRCMSCSVWRPRSSAVKSWPWSSPGLPPKPPGEKLMATYKPQISTALPPTIFFPSSSPAASKMSRTVWAL